ncbi:MAG TPA: hypothetical protein VFZ21_10535 [Gemmatimonadaceae bacterium]|nr:hypothetical protein [Gemmatimonadaceae bacterium]
MTAIAEPVAERSPAPTVLEPPEPQLAGHAQASWSPTIRIAFRFCVLYFGLYVLMTQMLGGMLPNPWVRVPVLAEYAPMRPLVLWVGNNLLGVQPTVHPTGSGDTLFDWTYAFTGLLLAALGTVAWSIAARRTSYPRLHKWFRLFLRVALGTTMFSYGFAKVFPLQMPTVFLSRLLEPFGDFSPMGVIWYSIGAAPGYERFIGAAEVLGGLLLLLPWTTLIGALVTLGVAFGVFMVNMTYDVPVKLFAFHLVLMSVVLIAPDTRRLVNWFVLNRQVVPAPAPRYGSSVRSHRRWIIAQLVFLVWALGLEVKAGVEGYRTYGPGAPKSPLYGIWNVDSMSIDGELRPPLTTDSLRYRYAVFQAANGMTLQKMDLSFVRFGATIDTVKRAVTLRKASDSTWKPVLAYDRPTPTRLTLEGQIDGKRVRMAMTQRDLNTFFLISRGFNWVQEYPVNR